MQLFIIKPCVAIVVTQVVTVLFATYASANPVAASPIVAVPWGDWLLSVVQYAIYTIALPVLAGYIAIYFKNAQAQQVISEICDKAVDYAIAVTEGAVKGKTFDVPMTNAVLSAAEHYIIANAPKWAKTLGDTMRPKILARIGAKTPLAPEVTAAKVGITLTKVH